jgi:UTP--glucose-1-phosphate uridylyltransferase
MSAIDTAVLPVAGRATRALPISKVIPKCLFPLGNKPVVQYAVEEALDAGIKRIVFVVNDDSELIRRYFERDPELEKLLAEEGKPNLLSSLQRIIDEIEFKYVEQRPLAAVDGTQRTGLGASVSSARGEITAEQFAVVLPNDLILGNSPHCLRQLVDSIRTPKDSAVACRRMPRETLSTYGNVQIEGERITDLIQRPAPGRELSDVAIIGRYVLSSDVFDIIASLQPGYGNEIQLTDALQKMVRGEFQVRAVEFLGDYFDTRTSGGLARAIAAVSQGDD